MWLSWSKYRLGSYRMWCIMGTGDWWEFPPFFQMPLTIPLHSPNGRQMPLGLCKETVKESRPGQNTTGSGLSDAHLEVFIPGASREWFPRFPALACTGDHVGTSHTCDKAEKTRVEWPAWIWRGLAAEMKNELQKKSTEQTWPRVLTSVGFLYLEYVEIQLCETKP